MSQTIPILIGAPQTPERLQGPLSSLLAKYCGPTQTQVEYSNSTTSRLMDILLKIQYQLQDMKSAQAARQVTLSQLISAALMRKHM